MSMNSSNSRRTFLKKSLAIISAAPVALAVGGLSPATAEDALKPIDASSAKATQLGYSPDATKVDLAKFPKHKENDGKQRCSNCQLMLQAGLKVDGQAGEWGKCALFPEGLVNTQGWCNSWILKAGTTL